MLEIPSLSLILNNITTWSVFAIFAAVLYHWWRPAHPNFPPGYRGFPFVGILPYLKKNPERVLKKWSSQMKQPIISVRLGSRDAVSLNTIESIQQVLVNNSIKTAGRPDLYSFTQLSKQNGIVFVDFSDTLKRHRTFALTHFKKGFGAGADAIENAVNEEVSCFIKYLRNLPQQPFCPNKYLPRLTMNMTCQLLIGKHYDYDDPTVEKVARLIAQEFGESEDAHEIVTSDLFPFAKYIPPFKGAWERAKIRNKILLKDFADPIIKEHKANLDPDNLKDYIDLFLNEQEVGKNKDIFTDEQLRHQIIDLLGGGTETTSVVISWAILCWLHFPEYQELVQTEIDTVLGKEKNPTMSMRNCMPMTCAFLHEVFRFRTPVNTIFRKSIKPISAMGYSIPAGTMILINLWGVHNDPQIWNNPEKFNPKRHINESGEFVRSTSVIPFCVGYRRCLGKNLALTELFIMFTKLLQNFAIEPCTETLPEINKSHNNVVQVPLRYDVNLVPR